MEEKELKTSTKQRVIIGLIAVIMVGTMVASYAAIVINGSKSSSATTEMEKLDDERMEYYQNAYLDTLKKFREISANDFATFFGYHSTIGTYDEAAANSGGVTSKDLLTGSGREIGAEDTNYLAYYAGWCADGSVFDSSFDSVTNPTTFSKVLDVSIGMVDGWNEGVVGMKLGGVREITMPGEKAYGENMEICGGYNKPLKFLVMAVANEEPLKSVASELNSAYMKLQYANYGIDYEKMMESSQEQDS